jgi:hypothetical protein
MEGATSCSLVRSSARAALRVFCFCVLCAGRRKEKRRERRREEKKKKWEKFIHMEISGKNNR